MSREGSRKASRRRNWGSLTSIIAASLFVIVSAGCDRSTDARLVGSWRGEDEDTIEEIAFHPDHTLVWWSCGKKDLSTPNTIVSSGEWQTRRNQIDVATKQLTWPTPLKHHLLQIEKISSDELLLKTPSSASPVKFVRLNTPACTSPAGAATPYPIEPNILGSWLVHYNTHDFKYVFTPDHVVSVSARDSGDFQPMWKGAWSVAGTDLVMDLKPDWKFATEQKVTWVVYGFQPRCFTIKDPYSVSYVVHRSE